MAKVSARNNGSLSGPDRAPLFLQWNDAEYPIDQLDEFVFAVDSPEIARAHGDAAVPALHGGKIRGVDESIQVQFRIRNIEGDLVLCGFHDLSIAARDRLTILAERARSPETDALQSLSYDELALGNTQKSEDSKALQAKSSSNLKKIIASVMLAASMLIIFVWILMVVRSQSTIAVSNSVMVGNYQVVNTPLEGRMLDLRVAVGDPVYAGQVLATIANADAEHELKVVESKVARAQKDLGAYRRQSIDIKAMLKIARATLQTKRLVATAVKTRIEGELVAAQSQSKRSKRMLRNGLITISAYEKVKALRDRWAAELEGQNAVIAGIALAQKAAANDVIVDNARITSPLSEIRTKIALAESLIIELNTTRDLLAAKANPAELVAPSSGNVFAIYRRPGDVLKYADEALAISRDDDSWAAGHIPPAAAASVRPGQKVEIDIPSYGIKTTGVVEAIGHRALYGRGGYTADFRGGSLDVPVRVAVRQISKPIPSGLRLNMTIRVRDYVKELRDLLDGWAAPVAGTTKPPHGRLGALHLVPQRRYEDIRNGDERYHIAHSHDDLRAGSKVGCRRPATQIDPASCGN